MSSMIFVCLFVLFLQKDMFELLFKLREDPNYFNSKMPGDHFKSFQLIWNERHSASKHNPWCSEF